jgi:EAL domain-containing protein (putative c-di-GMP-specific phosphodiesterase class I)
MSTTAEGVETEAQRKMLHKLGCTQMQGFLFSLAVPTGRLKELLGQCAPVVSDVA